MTHTPLRVLILAESCNPEWSSIPLVGWSHYEALSKIADVHLITRTRNRPALNRFGLKEGRDYTAINTEFVFEPMARLVQWISGPNKGWAALTALTIPSYQLFELIAWQRFKKQLATSRFDLVHRITPVSPAMPSPFAKRCHKLGVPFILGPINGGLPWPKEFPSLQKQEGEWLSRFRALFKKVPGYKATREASSAIIVGGKSAYHEIPNKWKNKVIYIPENGFDPTRFPSPKDIASKTYKNDPIKAVYLGRLVPYKGCDMLIEAASELIRTGKIHLTIIGSGPEEENIRGLITRYGINDGVTFTGELCHRQVAEHMTGADILTFPSVHEFGGAVVLEAMAMGVVPVITNYGGPAELASPQCAFLVPLKERAAYITSLKETLQTIVSDPSCLIPLSRNSQKRAYHLFTWAQKAQQSKAIYEWVLGIKPQRPNWGMPFDDK